MIQRKLYKSDINELLMDVTFITLLAIMFFLIVGKFGGHISDSITKFSCNAIEEKYIPGDKPGEGLCVKSTKYIDIKK